MKDIFPKIKELFDQGRFSVLATIIRQAGPTPRGIGTKCLIMDDGSFVGTVGGGILEARVIEEAGKIFDSGVSQGFTVDTPAMSIGGLQHQHTVSLGQQLAGCVKSCHAGANNDNVVFLWLACAHK